LTIYIENLEFSTIIGILDFERKQPQRIIVNAVIKYHYKKDYFINYVDICNLIKNEMVEQKFFLIEEALEYLINKIEKNYFIQYIKIKITKPDILQDVNVAVEMEKN